MRQFMISILCMVCCAFTHAQQTAHKETKTYSEKWYTTAEVDVLFLNDERQRYRITDLSGSVREVIFGRESTFLLHSVGFSYGWHYALLPKLSLGAVGGVQTIGDYEYLAFKLGADLKYFFVNRERVYIFSNMANNFSLGRNPFKGGYNVRAGLGFFLLRSQRFNINMALYFEQNYFRLDETIFKSVTLQSIGFSFGVHLKKGKGKKKSLIEKTSEK